MAYAAAKFTESCLKAMQGEPGIVECSYVFSHLTDLAFFASPLRLGPNGVEVCLCSPASQSLTCNWLVTAANAVHAPGVQSTSCLPAERFCIQSL